MPSIFDGLNIGISGLYAAQQELNVTGNNVANANTPGYTREIVNLTPGLTQFTSKGAYGTGVSIASITNARDDVLDNLLRENYVSQAYYKQLNSTLQNVESIFNETRNVGLSNALQQFFSSWQTLSQNPNLETARQGVISSAQTLINSIHYSYNTLSQTQHNLDNKVGSVIQQINTIAENIANINQQIKEGGLAPNQPANTLIDQRNVLINKLSKLTNITVLNTKDNTSDNATISILIGGEPLVSDTTYNTLSAIKLDGSQYNGVYFNYGNGQNVNITNKLNSGTLGAIINLRDKTIEDYKTQLNNIANTIIRNVNNVHSSGTGLTAYSQIAGSYYIKSTNVPIDSTVLTGLNQSIQTGRFRVIVTDSSGNDVGIFSINVNANDTLNDIKKEFNSVLNGYASMSISNFNQGNVQIIANSGYKFSFSYDSSHFLSALGVNTFFTGDNAQNIEINNVIQNDPSKIAAGTSLTPGDGSNAQAIADIQQSPTMVNNTQTINQYYDAFVGTIGSQKKDISSILNAKNAIVQQIANQKQADEGVSLNEEAANLIKYQTAYQASAKFISVIDQMTQTLMGIIQ